MPEHYESAHTPLDKETLTWTLGRIDGYISLMDTKCEVWLAALAICVGAVCSNACCTERLGKALAWGSGIPAFSLALCCTLACLASLYCLGRVLFPRAFSSKQHPSKLYFGDIARMEPKPTVQAYLKNYDDQRTVQEDIAGEIIACSKICDTKTRWFRLAFVASTVMLVAFVALMLLPC